MADERVIRPGVYVRWIAPAGMIVGAVRGLVLALVLGGCWGDPGVDRENVAFMRGDTGQVVVLACEGIEPDAVGVWRTSSDNRVIGDDGDVLLESVRPEDFGPASDGLVQSEMTASFDGAKILVRPGGAVTLDAEAVAPGEVILTDRRVMSVEEFAELVAAQDGCRRSGDG